MVNTCVSCRNRKVKCDGGLPRCSACTKARRPLECSYERSQWSKGTLAKREACLPCRKRKRRCDAGRPACGKCASSRKQEICLYEFNLPDLDWHHINKEDVLETRMKPSHRPTTDSSSSNVSRTPPSIDPPAKGPGRPSSIAIIPVPVYSGKSPPLHINSQYMNSFKIPRYASSIPPRPTIISNPPLLMEGVNESAFSLSGLPFHDMNMKFRLLFLNQRLFWGMYLPSAKQQAMLCGDTSNTVIHPFFIHFAHLSGCQLYQEQRGFFCCLPVQAVHLQLTLEAFAAMNEEDDPFSFALAHFYMGLAHGYVQNVKTSIRTLRRCVEIVRRNQIRFVPISTGDADQSEENALSTLPEFSEEVHERAAFLSQMLYSECFMYLVGQPGGEVYFVEETLKQVLHRLYSDVCVDVVGGKPDEISFDTEMQFRYELPDAYPILFEICPIALRVRSMILAKDASNLIAWFLQETPPSISWSSTCRIFLAHLTGHIASLTEKLAESESMRDRERSHALRFSSIFSLTTLAQVTWLMTRAPAVAGIPVTDYKRQCAYSLRRVVSLVEELTPEEFKFLDMFLGVHWTRAVELFTNEALPLAPEPSSVPWSSHAVSTAGSDDYEIQQNVARIAQFNEKFIRNRLIPDTMRLCEKLAKQHVNMARV